ncbi:MAG: [cytidine(C)-cytidine(C)-adenosine (A)]-adding enzyme [Myxococcales bacterium]|nr:[cytidine(C)-cytidine(C)-adenosine (A)]-adding enzyme [Myxococcales bacterium]
MSGVTPPAPIVAVVARLRAAGHEAWLVGGCVRDRLLGRVPGDWDVTTDAEPEAVMALFDRTVPTGLQHGTVTVVLGEDVVEVTTYRVDGDYTDGRRPDSVRFTRSLEEDLARRDFTMNAMAWDPLSDTLADPFEGRRDLDRRLIRAVGDAEARFTEDGLRALRAVRFQAVLDFAIEVNTLAAIPRTLRVFQQVSAERVRVELYKILGSAHAGRALLVLSETGMLTVALPAVGRLPDAGLAWVARALTHPLPAVDRLALVLRPVADEADAALRALRVSNDDRRRVLALLRVAEEPADPPSDAAVRALVARVTPALLDAWLAWQAAWADDAGPWAALAARIEALGARDGPLTASDLALDGRGLMALAGLPPSRRVGQVQAWLLARVWEDPTRNTEAGLADLLPAALAAVPERP